LLIQDSIVLTSGNLEVTKDLFINGIKSAELTVDASQEVRAIKMDNSTVTIKGLKIIVGTDPGSGAVLHSGMLTLIDIDIYNPTGTATSVIETTLSGTVTIRGSVTIQEN